MNSSKIPATDALVGTIAAASPVWLQWFDEVSMVSQKCLPILGVTLIILRMVWGYQDRHKHD